MCVHTSGPCSYFATKVVLQKIFQHSVCNNSDFIVQTVSEIAVLASEG